MSTKSATPNTAFWYFVAAVFIFASPILFFRDLNMPWVSIVALALGLIVVTLGTATLLREQRQRRSPVDPPAPTTSA